MTSEQKQKKTLDLTSGPVLPLMLRFCLPILLGNILQQFYNMVDAAVVGHYVGTNALAAVGATGALTFLIIGFVDGMCAGFCIPAAQSFGAGDSSMLRRCVMNIIWLGIFFSAVLTAVTSLCLGAMLDMMDFPEDIYGDAFTYLRVIFLGIPATVAYNTQAGLMRAMGNTRTPLLVLICAALVNVVLDLTFVCGLNLGVMGAAMATIISQILSAAVCFVYITRNYPGLRAQGADRRFNRSIARRLVLSVCRFSLQGLEHGVVAMFAGLFEMAARGLVALTFAQWYGFSAICWANPAAWIGACVLLVPACIAVFPRVRDAIEARRSALGLNQQSSTKG